MKNRDLTSGPVGCQLTGLTLSAFWGRLAAVGFALTDAFFVGQLGSIELASLSILAPLVLLINFGVNGFSVASMVSMSRQIGAGKETGLISSHTLILGATVGALIVLVGISLTEEIVDLLNIDHDLAVHSIAYLKVWFFGALPYAIMMVGIGLIRGTGNTLLSSIIVIMAAILNAVLDPILIFGLFGLPMLGVTGAAYATVISFSVASISAVLILLVGSQLQGIRIGGIAELLQTWKFNLGTSIYATLAKLAIPGGLVVVTPFVAELGTAASAGFGIAIIVENYAILLIFSALGIALGPHIGQNFGAQNYSRIQRAMIYSCIFCIIYGLVVFILFLIFSNLIISLFTSDLEIIIFTSSLLKWVSLGYGLEGIIIISAVVFYAVGRGRISVVISVVKSFLFIVPAVYLSIRFWDESGVFVGLLLSSVLAGTVAIYFLTVTCLQVSRETVT